MKVLAVLFAMVMIPIAHADPRADVQRSLEQVIAAGGFRAQVDGPVFGPGTPAMSGDVDVVFPDRVHARTDEIEFIAVPQGAWLHALGVWTETDRSLLPVTVFDPREMHKAIASIRDAREEGTSKTAQCAARVYRFRASGQLPGARADGDVRLWVCEGSGKPARLEATTAGAHDRLSLDFDWSHRPRVDAPTSR